MERIWHIKRFSSGSHHKFNRMSSVHAEASINLTFGSVYLYGQTTFLPLQISFPTFLRSQSAFQPFSLQALQISFSCFAPLKSAFQHLNITNFQHSDLICFSLFSFQAALQLFSFLLFSLFSFSTPSASQPPTSLTVSPSASQILRSDIYVLVFGLHY